MRVLMITTEYPNPRRPGEGIFIARQVEALRRAGVKVDVLYFQSRANPLNHLRAWRDMRRMIAETRCDLIHAQFAHAALIARMQIGLPVVATYRGDELYGIVGRRGGYTLKGIALVVTAQVLAYLVDEVMVVSAAMRRRLLRRDCYVIPSGIDFDLFRPMPRDEARRILGWPADLRIVLFASLGTNKSRKRLELAQAAVAKAAETFPVVLKVATGIEPEEMPLWMNASDALLLTSIHEGSPNVVKEALACNLPIVSVDVGDVRERVEGVTNCRICKPEAASLADGLTDVLRNPIRSNGRGAAVGQLDVDLLAQRVIAVYQRAVSHDH